VSEESRVAIVGLGYVGLTLGVALAQRGVRVFGVERREDVVAAANRGEPHFSEQGLAEVLSSVTQRGLFSAHGDFTDVPPCPSYVITVGTPLDQDGVPRLDMVKNATREVAAHMCDGALLILRSTVQIGTSRNVVGAVLKEAKRSASIAMCPERTLEGDALRELSQLPQIIGGIDREAADRAAELFGLLTSSVVRVSSPEAAEMIKLVDNTYRDVRFAFANEVARACDHLGIDAYEVIDSGKLGYQRTNVAYPGLVGGPCLEKDPHILIRSLSEAAGIDLEITRASRLVNERQPAETVAQALRLFARRVPGSTPRVAMLGLAFKGQPETDDLRGSMALRVLTALRSAGHADPVRCYDPVVSRAAIDDLALGLIAHDDMAHAVRDADLVFIANNHPSFRKFAFERLIGEMSGDGLVYDYWNNYGHESPKVLGNRYIRVGHLAAGEQA
jgi:UDP-N-acetyl-D-mannosaminuronic acid dehydrogenase